MTKKWRNACKNEFISIDLETTGLSPSKDKILEIAAIRYRNFEEADNFATLINPGIKIPEKITTINGITNEMVKDSPMIEDVLPKLFEYIGNSVLIAHNASFDLKFIKYNADNQGFDFFNPFIDTLSLCCKLFPEFENHKLRTIVEELCLGTNEFHRAQADARYVGKILIECINKIDRQEAEREISNL
ncbi:MAG: exonuclease domain-containing protein [Clostridiales bacterium]|jgi:DNA polymerase III epsilon subunit family exonuclease|nr:exonuclease domain-containing protein [Eubacteriales bacterium]MDH7566839.1 exonuclease domain-containing protein [Clostridiales bacterium]